MHNADNQFRPSRDAVRRRRKDETYHSPFSSFSSYAERLKSFSTFPKNSNQSKRNLSSAGFFYLGEKEKAFCLKKLNLFI